MFRSGKFHEKTTETALISLFTNLVLIVLGFVSAVYVGIFLSNKQTLDQELESRGRAIVESIILARNWSAAYGGVYVKKTQGMTSNPYLENPDIVSVDGVIYTKKNPALMVREISESVEKEGAFQFRITSLEPLNPANRPDAFEKAALVSFEKGAKEVFTKEHQDQSTFFRFMAPLIVHSSCLECHELGYELGDVRGGISVRFNIDTVEAALVRNMYLVAGLGLISFFSLFAIIYRLVRQFGCRLKKAEDKLRHLAVTDELTGLRNRRYLLERMRIELHKRRRDAQPLACIMFDLDHFKSINDTFGHEVGDRVLQLVAATAEDHFRESDVLSRFGGEEFMILLPGTHLEEGRNAAERLRQAIAGRQVPLPAGKFLSITASFGVSCSEELVEDTEAEEAALLKRVDQALYQAKEKGRNRVEVAV